MNTWAPIWSQIVDSSLWEEKLEVRVLFLTMLSNKDIRDHVVRMPLRRLCKKANLHSDPMENARLVKESLQVLLSPDSKSVDEQPYEGRRLLEVEGGWLVINGEFYQREMARMIRRSKKTLWQREERERKRMKNDGQSKFSNGQPVQERDFQPNGVTQS